MLQNNFAVVVKAASLQAALLRTVDVPRSTHHRFSAVVTLAAAARPPHAPRRRHSLKTATTARIPIVVAGVVVNTGRNTVKPACFHVWAPCVDRLLPPPRNKRILYELFQQSHDVGIYHRDKAL